MITGSLECLLFSLVFSLGTCLLGCRLESRGSDPCI